MDNKISNEPKWHIVHQLGDDAAIYDRQKQLFNVHKDEAQRICDVLNRLEAERQEFLNANYTLQDRFRRLEAENAELACLKKLIETVKNKQK